MQHFSCNGPVVGAIDADVPATMGEWAFVDQNSEATPSDFVYNGQTGVALINWGDGATSIGTVSSGGSSGYFNITAAPHIYTQDSYDQPRGLYTITVTVTDDDGNTLTGTQYVSVVRPPLVMDTGDVETSVNNATLSNVQVAAFTVPDSVDASSEFSASIDWGDNSSSSGTIQEAAPGLFLVLGNHTYAAAGWYAIVVTVSQGWAAQDPVARQGAEGQAGGGGGRITGPSVVAGPVSLYYQVTIPAGLRLTWQELDDPKNPNRLSVEVTDLKGKPTNDATTQVLVTSYTLPGDILTSFQFYATFKKAPSQVKFTPLLDGKPIAGVGSNEVDVVEMTITSSKVQHPDALPAYSHSLQPPFDPNFLAINTRPKGPGGQPVAGYPMNELHTRGDYRKVLDKYGFINDEVEVTINAPNPNQDLPKIHLGWIRDVTLFNVEIRYADGTVARVPEKKLGRFPIFDHSPLSTDPYFARSSTVVKDKDDKIDGKIRTVVALDAPGFAFPIQTPGGSAWTRTAGDWKFVDHLTAYSDDARTTFVVIATAPWGIQVAGKKGADGSWQPTVDPYVILPPNGNVITTGYPKWGLEVNTFNYFPPVMRSPSNATFWVFK